ncbi:CRISPR-associated protein Csx19 [Metasolibacillus meyeri]|uniref:type III-D CRISPR-associated protein Csx19 n=1 Tax=Metasolibacillus meyeri TaxID=1071052 RepID=UPI00187D3B02|nr:CRISPR-associated protein Csx19 [Metasolibacillus meyeri]
MKHKSGKSEREIKSISQDELLTCIRAQENGDMYVMADQAVYFGKLVNGNIQLHGDTKFEEAYIQEVRIFDSEKELKLTRVNGNFIARLRKDGTGEETIYFDDTHKLWGSGVKCDGEWSVLEEGRGMELAIPKKFAKDDAVVLIFRKYLAFQEWDPATAQSFRYTVVDERLVEYQKMEEAN